MNSDFDRIANHIDKFCYPIYARDMKYDEYELFGSCVAVSVGGDKRICTANHVIDELKKSGKQAVIGGNSGFETLDISTRKSLTVAGVDTDICLVESTNNNNNNNIQYISHRSFYQTDKFFGTSFQYLQGYPLTKNKFKDLHKGAVLTAGRIGVGMMVDQQISYPREDKNTDYHYFFKYDGGVYEKAGQEPQEINSQSAPQLKGLSGCGVWNVYNIKDLTSIKLMGIFIELEHRIGVATKTRKLHGIK